MIRVKNRELRQSGRLLLGNKAVDEERLTELFHRITETKTSKYTLKQQSKDRYHLLGVSCQVNPGMRHIRNKILQQKYSNTWKVLLSGQELHLLDLE